MFEVRWLKKDTGHTTQNEWGFYEPVMSTTLQFRYKYSKISYGYNPNIVQGQDVTETVWSDWQDVPTVIQHKEK